MSAVATSTSIRPRAVAAIIARDLATLGPYAVFGAIGMFTAAALVHTEADLSALVTSLPFLDAVVKALLWGGLPVVMAIFLILLAQTNVASDTRHDWLIRPLAPLELAAAKAVQVGAVIVAPMFLGNLVYMVTKGGSFAEASELLLLVTTCCVLVLTAAWLASTPFRAVLSVLGAIVVMALAVVLAEIIKTALSYMLAFGGERVEVTPFPNLDDNWIVSAAMGVSLYVAAGVALWLLLARRKRATARWVFFGYFAIAMFAQTFLFTPVVSDTPTGSARMIQTR